MRPEWVSFAEVKAAVSMRLVLEDYGVLEKLRRSGGEQYRGRCPIHRREGPDAFHAHLGKNVFHCFACGACGNVLHLVAALEQCSAQEAALRLQWRHMVAGAPAPLPAPSTAPAPPPSAIRCHALRMPFTISSTTWGRCVGFRSSTRYRVVTPPTVFPTRLPSPS